MDNQHRQVKGYRELCQEEIDLMNEIKDHGRALEALCQKLDSLRSTPIRVEDPMNADGKLICPDTVWFNKGKIALQEGLMFLTRSITKPDFF